MHCHRCLFALQVPDMETGFEFRQAMYDHMGLPLPEKPGRRVLLWLRQHLENRRLQNIDAIIDVLNTYNMSYT